MLGDTLQVLVFDGDSDKLASWVAAQRERPTTPQATAWARLSAGLEIQDAGLASRPTAEAHIRDKHTAGATPIAVSYTGCVPSGMARLEKRLVAREESLAALHQKTLGALQGGASATTGCKACGSKLARKYIKSLECPLCGTIIAPAGTRARIDKFKSEIDELQTSIKYAREHANKVPGKCWLVGGLVSDAE